MTIYDLLENLKANMHCNENLHITAYEAQLIVHAFAYRDHALRELERDNARLNQSIEFLNNMRRHACWCPCRPNY